MSSRIRRARKTRGARFLGRAGREGAKPRLSSDWQAWLAENALLGVADDALLATLGDHGVPARLARAAIRTIRRSPIFAAARPAARQALRYELLTRLERETAKLGSARGVERRTGLTPEEFFDHYYAHGIPVVLTDALAPWPAVTSWSLETLSARFADADVEMSRDRDGDPTPDVHTLAHAAVMRFGDFLDRVKSSSPTNDFYLTANNRNAGRPGLAGLVADLAAPHPLLDDTRHPDRVLFWLGPAGTRTPLHHDTRNVLLCHVFGKKRITLYPRFEVALTEEMHDEVYAALDPEKPDLDAFPWHAEATKLEVVLEKGEGLFIPIGCFHHVIGLEPSMSLAFTAFRRANDFGWYYPGRSL